MDNKRLSNMLEIISEIYLILIVILFPLIVNSTGYFKILECKWYAFLIMSTGYVFINLFIILYYLIIRKINIFKIKKITIIQWTALIFLLINIVSTFLSPYFQSYDLFIGIGRGEGLIMISLYVLSFVFLSLFLKFKKRYILYFSMSLILINIVAILQYVGFNPFNLYQNGIGTHNVSFMTTIGNIDFISALYCILLTISFSAFIFLDDIKSTKFIHLLAFIMGFFILNIIDVQSNKIAFLAIISIILPFIFTNNKKLSRALVILASFLFTYVINIIINPEFHYDTMTLKLYPKINLIVIIFICIIIGLLCLAKVVKNINYDYSKNKKVYKYYYIILAGVFILGIASLYFINFKSGILYEIHEILHGNFNDKFGTYRVFLWKRSINLVNDYPLIGTGPDTFAVRFMSRYTNDIKLIGPLTLNDTAGNVYLTMLINIGLAGLLSYLCFLFVQIKKSLSNINDYSKILLIAIGCFLIQDFFNLWVVIITPIFWILMAVNISSLNKE